MKFMFGSKKSSKTDWIEFNKSGLGGISIGFQLSMKCIPPLFHSHLLLAYPVVFYATEISRTYLTYNDRFWLVRRDPDPELMLWFIICSRRSWILASKRPYSKRAGEKERNKQKKHQYKVNKHTHIKTWVCSELIWACGGAVLCFL